MGTDNPETYSNWRLTTKATVVCHDDAHGRLVCCLELVEDMDVSDAVQRKGADELAPSGARRVDRHMYSAALGCLGGSRRDEIIDEIRTTAVRMRMLGPAVPGPTL